MPVLPDAVILTLCHLLLLGPDPSSLRFAPPLGPHRYVTRQVLIASPHQRGRSKGAAAAVLQVESHPSGSMPTTALSPDPIPANLTSQSDTIVDTTPSLRNLNVWAYLSLSFIIIATTTITLYALYSCYHSARRNAYLKQHKNGRFTQFTDSIHGLGSFRHSAGVGSCDGTPLRSKPGFQSSPFSRSPFKKEWFKSDSQISLAPSEPTNHHDTDDPDSIILNQPPIVRPISFGSSTHNAPYIEPKTLPSPPQPVAFPSSSSCGPPSQQGLDLHNIRFVPPQGRNENGSSPSARIWTDPKLSPVMGPPALPPGLGCNHSLATGRSGSPVTLPGLTPLAVAASPHPRIGANNDTTDKIMGSGTGGDGDVGSTSSPSSKSKKKQKRVRPPKTPNKTAPNAEKT